MKKIIVIIIALVAIGGVAYLMIGSGDEATDQTTDSSTAQTSPEQAQTVPQPITTEEVAAHSSEEDCWTIIQGKVYDLTSFIADHPGGDEILRACGTDSTTLFTQRETADGQEVGTGTPHSAEAQEHLDQLLVGTLAQ